MAAVVVLGSVFLFWAAVTAFRVLASKLKPQLLSNLRQNGLSIETCYIKWEMSSFNRLLNGFRPKKCLNSWQYSLYCRYFTFGVWLNVILIPYALFIITKSLLTTLNVAEHLQRIFSSSASANASQSEIEMNVNNSGFMVVIPGISIPLHECIYFVLAVAISSFIHEMGHALAANRHKMRIYGVGIGFYICFPVTFVAMKGCDQSKIENLFRQLEVMSAGLLNNAVLCLVTLLCYVFNPLALLYVPANGLVISNVDPLSSISNSLMPNDLIKSINGQPVASLDDWQAQLQAITYSRSGLCVPSDFVEQHKSSIASLCKLKQCCLNDEKNLCFVMHLSEADQSEEECQFNQNSLGNLQQSFNISTTHLRDNFLKWHRSMCLPARKVTEVATQLCSDNSNCMQTYFGKHLCLRPYSSQPLTRLFVLEVEPRENTILFWGPAAELYQALSLSTIKPRFSFIPITLYEQLNVFYRYLFSMSFSLILFNLLPFNPFDGYHIFSLSSLLYFGRERKATRRRVLICTHLVAIVLVFSSISVAFLQLKQFLF